MCPVGGISARCRSAGQGEHGLSWRTPWRLLLSALEALPKESFPVSPELSARIAELNAASGAGQSRVMRDFFASGQCVVYGKMRPSALPAGEFSPLTLKEARLRELREEIVALSLPPAEPLLPKGIVSCLVSPCLR